MACCRECRHWDAEYFKRYSDPGRHGICGAIHDEWDTDNVDEAPAWIQLQGAGAILATLPDFRCSLFAPCEDEPSS